MSNQKTNVILDLDQTLISAEPTEECDLKKCKEKARNFKFHDMDGYYVVFERPGLQKFLDFLFANFNVSVWTAASKDYALFVIDKILIGKNKDRKLDYIFFSYHCDISKKKKNGSKCLSMLWDVYNLPGYDEKNTVIIDDYDEVHRTQNNNCLIAIPFEFTKENSHKDNYLENAEKSLKKISSGTPLKIVVEEANGKSKLTE